jgi:hypothetical protein
MQFRANEVPDERFVNDVYTRKLPTNCPQTARVASVVRIASGVAGTWPGIGAELGYRQKVVEKRSLCYL